MKKDKFSIWIFNFSILGLIYNLYYFAMKHAVGGLMTSDKLICLFSSTAFILIILYNIITFIKTSRR